MAARTNLNSFWEEMQKQWGLIPKDTLVNLVHSLPKRLRAVTQNKGGNTNY